MCCVLCFIRVRYTVHDVGSLSHRLPRGARLRLGDIHPAIPGSVTSPSHSSHSSLTCVQVSLSVFSPQYASTWAISPTTPKLSRRTMGALHPKPVSPPCWWVDASSPLASSGLAGPQTPSITGASPWSLQASSVLASTPSSNNASTTSWIRTDCTLHPPFPQTPFSDPSLLVVYL